MLVYVGTNVGIEVHLACHFELSFNICTDLWLLFPGGSVMEIESLLRQNSCRSVSIFTDVQRFSLLIFGHCFESSKEPMYCIIRLLEVFHQQFLLTVTQLLQNLHHSKFWSRNVGIEVNLPYHFELSFNICTDLWLLFPGGSVMEIESLLQENNCRSVSIFTDVQRFSLLIFGHYFESSKKPMYCNIRLLEVFHQKI